MGLHIFGGIIATSGLYYVYNFALYTYRQMHSERDSAAEGGIELGQGNSFSERNI